MSTNHTLESLSKLSLRELKNIARQIGMVDYCCGCGWGDDCFRFRILFHQAQDEDWSVQRTPDKPNAEDLIRLYFSPYKTPGGNDKYWQWRRAIEVNLSTTALKVKLPQGKPSLRVARHHFARGQVRRITEDKVKVSTPLPIRDLEGIVWSVDTQYKVIRKRGKKSENLYFSIPNVPLQAVRVEATGANSTRTARRVTMEQTLAQRKLQQEEDAKRNEYDMLSFESFCKSKDVTAELQRRLKAQDTAAAGLKRELEKEIEKKDEVIRQLKAKNHNATRPSRPPSRNRNIPETEGGTNVIEATAASSSTPGPPKLNSSEREFLQNSLRELGLNVGGLSRVTLLSRQWHEIEKNKGAANTLFGFYNFEEMLIYVKIFFPDVDTSVQPQARVSSDGKWTIAPRKLSSLEHCLAAKMFMHAIPIQTIVAKIFGVSPQQIGRIIANWAPRWGQVGEFLSILPMPEGYYAQELPDEFRLHFLPKTGAMLDGKDFLAHTKRKDDFMRRVQYGNKTGSSAARGINWVTPSGLSFEHTKLFGSRCLETRLVQLWGSLGVAYAKIKEWRNWANLPENRGYRQEVLRLRTSLDEVDYKPVATEVAKRKRECDSVANDPDSDAHEPVSGADEYDGGAEEPESVVEITEVVTDVDRRLFNALMGEEGEQRERHSLQGENTDEDQADATSDDDDDSEGGDEGGETINVAQRRNYIDVTQEWNAVYDTWVIEDNILSKYTNDDDKRRKSVKLDRADYILREAEDALKNSPQDTPLLFIQQLELHERLDRAYKEKKLVKTILAYFLEMAAPDRHDWLDWMGSKMVPEGYAPTREDDEPPKVALRLAKIPEGYEQLGDKGFAGIERYMPFMNKTRTPLIMRTRDVKQYDVDEIVGKGGKKDLCRMRYTSEVSFKLMTSMNGLKDVIPYPNIRFLPYMYELGYAMMNLNRTPLRCPGNVPPDYFEAANWANN